MDHYLHELYHAEIDRASLDFDADSQYQAYLSQAEALWPDGELPAVFFQLLDASNFLSFSHGFQLGMGMTLWGLGAFRRLGGE